MAYLDEDHAAQGDVAISTYPAAAAPGNGVSMAAVLKWINDALQGSLGVVTFPAAAAPANGVSLAEVLRACYALLSPTIATGTTDIDDSVQDESAGWFDVLTIEPAAGAPLSDVEVWLDLAKATTGYAAVESSATIQFRVARKVDGTNLRGQAAAEAAVSGTNAAGRMIKIPVGNVGVTEDVVIQALMSADATGDMELPYAVSYKGIAAPTITPVAAG